MSLLIVAISSAAEQKTVLPDMENVSYGPHERNVLDLWKAKSDKPTPLVVFIHGGGFVNGDKRQVRGRPVIDQCLDAGARSPRSITAFASTLEFRDILRDAGRAIQFVRAHAKEWNIDPARIAAFGSSAAPAPACGWRSMMIWPTRARRIPSCGNRLA